MGLAIVLMSDVGEFIIMIGVVKKRLWLLLSLMSVFLFSCSSTNQIVEFKPLYNQNKLPKPDIEIEIPSLKSCTYTEDKSIRLNSTEPVVVIVHGCFSSAGRFRSLADVFAFHGQQAICFEYDDRDSLEKSSAELIDAVATLRENVKTNQISVIAHSQGGLIARRALIEERDNALNLENTDLSLISISAPYGGIQASSHCGSTTLAILSLGLTKPICKLITGDKYRDIHPNSNFIRSPGTLKPFVSKHIKIVTDEAGSCRRFSNEGRCLEDDYVFSVEEQYQNVVDAEKSLVDIVSKAGHVEIVGDENVPPTKLIEILQQHDIMNHTSVSDVDRLKRLLGAIY